MMAFVMDSLKKIPERSINPQRPLNFIHRTKPLSINNPSFQHSSTRNIYHCIPEETTEKMGNMCALSLIERWRTRLALY